MDAAILATCAGKVLRLPVFLIPHATLEASQSGIIRDRTGPLAQPVEQLAFNQLVARSNRARPTILHVRTSAMANDLPDDQEETLDDYEAGFLDGYFAARGINSPNEEQLVEAFQVLDDFIERNQPDEE